MQRMAPHSQSSSFTHPGNCNKYIFFIKWKKTLISSHYCSVRVRVVCMCVTKIYIGTSYCDRTVSVVKAVLNFNKLIYDLQYMANQWFGFSQNRKIMKRQRYPFWSEWERDSRLSTGSLRAWKSRIASKSDWSPCKTSPGFCIGSIFTHFVCSTI